MAANQYIRANFATVLTTLAHCLVRLPLYVHFRKMTKPSMDSIELAKKRKMRNARKKRRRQQRTLNRRAAAASVIARELKEAKDNNKARAEKYSAKWKRISNERKERMENVVQPRIRQVSECFDAY